MCIYPRTFCAHTLFLGSSENQEDINKYNRRLVRVTPEHNAEAKKLLRLLGVPVIEVRVLSFSLLELFPYSLFSSDQAPGEAEAQCAALCRDNKVYATATEDMDALTFGSPRLLVGVFGCLVLLLC